MSLGVLKMLKSSQSTLNIKKVTIFLLFYIIGTCTLRNKIISMTSISWILVDLAKGNKEITATGNYNCHSQIQQRSQITAVPSRSTEPGERSETKRSQLARASNACRLDTPLCPPPFLFQSFCFTRSKNIL